MSPTPEEQSPASLGTPSATKPPSPMPRASHTPEGTAVFGMWLFLAALGMLFAASLLGYLIIRYQAHATPEHSIDVPWVKFTISTVVILMSSLTLGQAVAAVRAERQSKLRGRLIATLVLAGLFLIVQTPAMVQLVGGHFAYLDDHPGQPPAMFGLVFFLVLIHALHVIGGLIPLAMITVNAHRGRYDHESYGPVRYTTMYWHFLDGVWVVMFTTFALTS